MRPSVISADVLFEAFRGRLRWEWLAGLGASDRHFDEMAVRSARSGADLVGYLNYIHPYRVQVLGEREATYVSKTSAEDSARRLARIVTLEPPVLVLADGQLAEQGSHDQLLKRDGVYARLYQQPEEALSRQQAVA